MKLPAAFATLVLLLAVACNDGSGSPDGGGGPLNTGDAGQPDANGDAGDAADADAGDAGDGDAGDGDAGDAGDGDAGTDAGDGGDGGDPLAGLEPVKPECVNQSGDPSICWRDWLKEIAPVEFAPVAKGALGAGPWPVADLTNMGGAEGLDGTILGVGVDTAQNVYAVTRDALFIRRAGAATFERYARNTSGLRDYALLSVAGGGPGVAYVGYDGVHGIDPETDPPEIRKSGDVQKITLTPGGFTAQTWDTHNSNTPISGKYDHSRDINEIVVPRRGPAAGEVFLGTEHGVVRYQGKWYVDHVHIATDVGGSQRFGGTHALTVLDDGTMWYANDFQLGGKAWTPRRYEWYEGRWIFPSHAYGDETDRDHYEGIAVDSNGEVWVGARTKGVAHMVLGPNRRSFTYERLSPPDSNITDLVIDDADILWLATDSGVYRYDIAASQWSKLSGVRSGVRDLYVDDTVVPRTLWIAHASGVSAYRGP